MGGTDIDTLPSTDTSSSDLIPAWHKSQTYSAMGLPCAEFTFNMAIINFVCGRMFSFNSVGSLVNPGRKCARPALLVRSLYSMTVEVKKA